MALCSECTPQCAPKELDTADIVREACFRQLSPDLPALCPCTFCFPTCHRFISTFLNNVMTEFGACSFLDYGIVGVDVRNEPVRDYATRYRAEFNPISFS